MTEKKGANKWSSLTQRVITAVILIAIMTALFAVGGWPLAVAIYLCLSMAIYEELHTLKLSGRSPVWWTSFVGLTVSVPLMLRDATTLAPIPLLTALSFCVLIQIMLRKSPELEDVMVSVLPMLTLVLPGMCLFGILNTQPRALQLMLLVFMITASVGCDTFAYFAGSLIGGKKLCPHISPNKTVAGAVGGLVGGVLCTVLAGLIFERVTAAAYAPLWANALVGLVGAVAAQVGDLFASMVKRHCNAKDFGHIFPGHGGMLDRLDSIVFTAIVIYCYRVMLLAMA